MKEKSIKLNAVLNGLHKFLNLVFPLITFPYVSRILSVEGIGKYNFSNSIVTYFMLISALGINTFAVREGSKYRNDKKSFSDFASKVFSINIVSTLIAYMALFGSLLVFDKLKEYDTAILIFSVQIIFTTIGTEWIYSIYEEYAYITVRSIAFKIVSIVLMFIFVKQSTDYIIYIIVTVFATVGSNILNFIHAKSFCNIRLTFRFNVKEYLKPIMIIFASYIAVRIYVNSDITMLGLLKNDYEVGIYGVSTRIYSMVKDMLQAVLLVTIPRLSLYWGKGNREEYDKLLKKVTSTMIVLVVPAIIGLFIVGKDVILIIAGKNYIESVPSLRILCFAILCSIFSWIFNSCVLVPSKREKFTLRSSIISATVNVILNLWLIPLYGSIGAAITTLISEGLMMIMNYYSCKDIVRSIVFNRYIIHVLVSSILGCIAIILISLYIGNIVPNLIFRMLLTISASIVSYMTVLLLTKNPIAWSYFKQFAQRINRK